MKRVIFLLVVVLLVGELFAKEKEIIGRVVSVSDGDTIRVLQNKKEYKIRFFGIDAPEKDQAFGQKSKQRLSDLVFGKEVKVIWKEKDQYRRYLGIVYLGSLNINQEMVRGGYAWVYRRYNDDSTMIELETKAKETKQGLWHHENPTPPWKFRKNQREDNDN